MHIDDRFRTGLIGMLKAVSVDAVQLGRCFARQYRYNLGRSTLDGSLLPFSLELFSKARI
jgi:hypothetical protein